MSVEKIQELVKYVKISGCKNANELRCTAQREDRAGQEWRPTTARGIRVQIEWGTRDARMQCGKGLGETQKKKAAASVTQQRTLNNHNKTAHKLEKYIRTQRGQVCSVPYTTGLVQISATSSATWAKNAVYQPGTQCRSLEHPQFIIGQWH